jgi:hypothetical protein
MEHRYDHFSRELLLEDMAWRAGPEPGEEMWRRSHAAA